MQHAQPSATAVKPLLRCLLSPVPQGLLQLVPVSYTHLRDIPCMAEAAVIAAEISGADIIDINMGCPVGKIVPTATAPP